MKKPFSVGSGKSKQIAEAVQKLREGNIDLSAYVDDDMAQTSTRPYSESTFNQYVRYDKSAVEV